MKVYLLMIPLLALQAFGQVKYRDLRADDIVVTGQVSNAQIEGLYTDGTNTYQIDDSMVTNQFVVSPIGTNNVPFIWGGTYQQFLALPSRSSSGLYFSRKDDIFDTTGIYQQLEDYNVVPDGTTTVFVTEGKAVYVVNVTTNTVIDFDVLGLNLTNRCATFELWVKYLNTAAVLTWEKPVYWVSGDPTFTAISTNYFVIRAFDNTTFHGNLQYSK